MAETKNENEMKWKIDKWSKADQWAMRQPGGGGNTELMESLKE